MAAHHIGRGNWQFGPSRVGLCSKWVPAEYLVCLRDAGADYVLIDARTGAANWVASLGLRPVLALGGATLLDLGRERRSLDGGAGL